MDGSPYRKQVALLLRVLPEVAKETCFALHGGTAINLFVREMPRLSVDIDLTYIPTVERQSAHAGISAALERITVNLARVIPEARVTHQQQTFKLQISIQGVQVKVEVNPNVRGCISDPEKQPLCRAAQDEFDVFASIQVVPLGQLYGGKICAALDRQHPRDLFDTMLLLKNEGITEEIKRGFLLALLSSERPIHEVIAPNLQDQQQTFKNHFVGISKESFAYEDFQNVRDKLITLMQESLTEQDKVFLLSFKDTNPDWSTYHYEAFPAVQWKLQNIKKLKEENPEKHQRQYEHLKAALGL